MKKTFSVSGAAQALGIGRTKIFKMLRAQQLKGIRIGRRRLILADSIDKLIESARVEEGR
jgi:excisionase family DNA binding protein